MTNYLGSVGGVTSTASDCVGAVSGKRVLAEATSVIGSASRLVCLVGSTARVERGLAISLALSIFGGALGLVGADAIDGLTAGVVLVPAVCAGGGSGGRKDGSGDRAAITSRVGSTAVVDGGSGVLGGDNCGQAEDGSGSSKLHIDGRMESRADLFLVEVELKVNERLPEDTKALE